MSKCSTSVASVKMDSVNESEMGKGSTCKGSTLRTACAEGHHYCHHRHLRPRPRRAIHPQSRSPLPPLLPPYSGGPFQRELNISASIAVQPQRQSTISALISMSISASILASSQC